MTNFRIRKIKDLTQQELDTWRALALKSDPSNNPLLQPDYIRCVSKVRGDVRIGIAERAGKTVGFLPFHLQPEQIAKPIGDTVSDLHAFLDDGSIGAQEWVRGLGLKRFDFDHLLPTKQAKDSVFAYDDWFRIDLSAGFDSYTSELQQSSFLNQTKRKKRKLEREMGQSKFVWNSTELHRVEKLLHWKFTNAKRSLFRKKPSPFPAWAIDLIHELASEGTRNCRGILSLLFAGKEVAAAHYGITNSKTLVSWLPAVNPKFQKFSAGNILLLELARTASDRGIHLIDLGRGENQTKSQMANDVRQLAIGSVCTSKIEHLRLRMGFQIKQQIKRLIGARSLTKPKATTDGESHS